MAFIDQVQDLTSLTVADNDELSQFLKDGVLDVTHRILRLDPTSAEGFIRATAEQTSNGDYINGATIVSVVRESGTNNDWRECRKINIGLQSKVTDSSSLEYASKFNPAYIVEENGKVNVYPAPGVNPDAYIIYYINNVPVNKDLAALSHSDTEIGYFPDDKIYLVIMYAGIKLLHTAMAALHSNSDVTTALTAANTEMDETQAICDLINTQVDAAVAELAEAVTNVDSSVDTALAAITTALGRVNTAVALGNTEFDLVNAEVDLANAQVDDEDVELAQGYMATAQGYSQAGSNYISEAQASLAEAQGYAAEVSARTNHTNAQISVSQGYLATAQSYAAEIQSKAGIASGYLQEAQGRFSILSQEYQWYNERYQQLKSEYNEAFGVMASTQKDGAK